jgi:uncharacterized protein YidB (DUF937 family)
MSQLDDLLGGLLGGQGGSGGLEDILGQLTGRQGGSGTSSPPTGGGAGMLAALLPLLATFLSNGGLSKILAGFQERGQGTQAESWISTGGNESVSGSDLEDVMGREEIASIADKLGLSEEETADALAQVLPQVVDKVSPEGQLPPENELDDLFAQLAGMAGKQ